MGLVGEEIEALSRKRQAIWFSGEPYRGGDVDRLSSRLTGLYEQKRHELAQRGARASRADIVRRARVESELERLMSEKTR